MWIICDMNVNNGKSHIFQKNYTQDSTFFFRYSHPFENHSYVDKNSEPIGMNRV